MGRQTRSGGQPERQTDRQRLTDRQTDKRIDYSWEDRQVVEGSRIGFEVGGEWITRENVAFASEQILTHANGILDRKMRG